MEKKLRLVIMWAFIGIGCGVLTSCGESEVNSSSAGAGSNAIMVNDNFYDLADRTVLVGMTVEWSWQGNIGHSVTGGTPVNPDGTFDSGIKSMGTFSHKFDTEGTFSYYCRVHGASMTGTIKVTAPSDGGNEGPY